MSLINKLVRYIKTRQTLAIKMRGGRSNHQSWKKVDTTQPYEQLINSTALDVDSSDLLNAKFPPLHAPESAFKRLISVSKKEKAVEDIFDVE